MEQRATDLLLLPWQVTSLLGILSSLPSGQVEVTIVHISQVAGDYRRRHHAVNE